MVKRCVSVINAKSYWMSNLGKTDGKIKKILL